MTASLRLPRLPFHNFSATSSPPEYSERPDDGEFQMAAKDGQTHSRLIPLAQVSDTPGSSSGGDGLAATQPYTCQTCAKRKVKCDKVTPVCSSCHKGKLQCFYQAPLPRRRKRKLSGDVGERLARYERILRQHGLLPVNGDTSPLVTETQELPEQRANLEVHYPESSKPGKLLAHQGKSRYITSDIWRTLGDDEVQNMSLNEAYEEEEHQIDNGVAAFSTFSASDPLTEAFMVSQHSLSLLSFHPSHETAKMLWKKHIENVQPLCKILHIPSTAKMVERISQRPETASTADECLLFSVYLFAVYSVTEEDCLQICGHPRDTMLQRYHFAARQALVNATFLKTTEISILQALVLFLLSCRYLYDPNIYWILTGVALRIGQRMGLHRDGEELGLPPFDVEMRRRLFYQLLPLDIIASQMSGAGFPGFGVREPASWDTKPPLNVDDDRIWPGMTQKPKEQKGATEMIFCLTRVCLAKFFNRIGTTNRPDAGKNYKQGELVVAEAESELEEKYIRYCDVVNPLHIMTISLARAGISCMRLRLRLPKDGDQTVTDAERRELFQLAQKIIDADSALFAHTGLKRFLWHVKPFFLWGSWDSLVFILTSLWKPDALLSPEESDAAWSKVEEVYHNHNEFFNEAKRALHVAFRRLTLKSWDANPPRRHVPEPAFIANLRSLPKANKKSLAERPDIEDSDKTTDALDATTETGPRSGLRLESDADRNTNALFGGLPGGMGTDIGHIFNLDAADWMFWDQLMTET